MVGFRYFGLLAAFSFFLYGNWESAGEALKANSPSSDAGFGQSVAVGSLFAVVGEPESGRHGTIYIFKKENEKWVPMQMIDIPEAAHNSPNRSDLIKSFGWSVALAESSYLPQSYPPMIAVGAVKSYWSGTDAPDGNRVQTGAVCPYILNGNQWEAVQPCIMEDAEGGLGFDVDLSNWTELVWDPVENKLVFKSYAYMVAGNPYFDGDETDEGAAFLYKYNSSDKKWELTIVFRDTEGKEFQLLGKSVAIDKNHILVGAPDYGLNAFSSHNGKVFHYLTDGTLKETLFYPDEIGFRATDLRFGASLDMSGDYAIIGSLSTYREGYAGSAFVYHLENNGTMKWIERLNGSIIDDSNDDDGYGLSVSITNHFAVVGAPYYHTEDNSGNRDEHGAVFIYRKDDSGNWNEIRHFIGASDSKLGTSVSLFYDGLMVGVPNKEEVQYYKYINTDASIPIIMYLLH